MSDLIPFSFESHEVRAVTRDGHDWFVLADVCKALEIEQPTSSARHLDDDERGLHTMHTPGGPQNVAVISESGLYSLTLRSRKPEAKRFKKWITAEVLPALRKSGHYGVPAVSGGIDYKELAAALAPAMRAEIALAVTNGLEIVLPTMVQGSIDAATYSLVRDHISVGDLLDQQRIPSKGRRGLVTIVARALGTWCRARGAEVRERVGTKRPSYLYPVVEARAWLAAEGAVLIKRWLKNRGEQQILPFPKTK